MDIFTAAQALKEIEKAYTCFNTMDDFPRHRDPDQFFEDLQTLVNSQEMSAEDKDWYRGLLMLYSDVLVCRKLSIKRIEAKIAQERAKIAVINIDKFHQK